MRHIKRFFTLIELMAVIAIVLILAGLLFPALKKVKESAWGSQCKNNLHGIGTGFQMYLQENSDFMPNAAQMPSQHLTDDPPIGTVLDSKIPNKDILRCPADVGAKGYFALFSDDSDYSFLNLPESGMRIYYKDEGSSYEYNVLLGGKHLKDSQLVKWRGEAGVPVMIDYIPFHGKPGTSGAANFLFADWHVGDMK